MDMDICKECAPPAPRKEEDGQENCFAVQEFRKYYVSSYYKLSSPEQMKADIYHYGPISCGIFATPAFESYTSGIYS